MRAAFIHYPHNPISARIETMPFALNSVLALAASGVSVDLYLWEDKNENYLNLFPKNVHIKYCQDPDRPFIIKWALDRARIKSYFLKFRFQFSKQYNCVFGLGQIGAYIASILSKHSHCPFIYYNDEFPSCWMKNIWAELEEEAVKNATLVVVPDLQRFLPLAQELDIATKPYAELPNIPINSLVEKIDWHRRLNIPEGYFPFLHAGSVADWSQIPELLSSFPYWPEKTVLIIHSRSKEGMLAYRQQLSHLDIFQRVIWSFEPLEDSLLNSLVSYSTANFALYRNSGPNIEYMGFSSGKIMRSLANGCPVIASDLKSLKFIEKNQLGLLVKHPVEIPKCIEKIIENRETYSKKCTEFSIIHASFASSWENLCLQINNITGLKL